VCIPLNNQSGVRAEVTVNNGFEANGMVRIQLINTVKGKTNCEAQIPDFGLFRDTNYLSYKVVSLSTPPIKFI
jgi:hypothetical protein